MFKKEPTQTRVIAFLPADGVFSELVTVMVKTVTAQVVKKLPSPFGVVLVNMFSCIIEAL